MSIQISVTGLAKFMRGAAAAQRGLLQSYKFPYDSNGNKRPQIVRYSEARTAIRKYHESGNDLSVLMTAIEDLLRKQIEHPEKDSVRIQDNIRAVNTYMKHFSKNNFTVLENPKPKYVHDEVTVTATPDLFVAEDGRKKLIKLDFNSHKPDEQSVGIILKVMYEAATAAELGVHPRDVIYLDVSRQESHVGKKMNKRLLRDIEAACKNIADIWPRISQK